LVPSWRYCKRASVDFKDARVAAKRVAAEKCFTLLVEHCSGIASFCVRNWCMLERSGLRHLGQGFPRLQHLELSGCDQISSYDLMVPVFNEHPTLLSLRAAFHPRAAAGLSFTTATPPTLMALGFVNFDSPGSLATLLERCNLQHLWFSADGNVSAAMVGVLAAADHSISTLSLPSCMAELECLEVARACPKLELLCRMRVGHTGFGNLELASDFEALPAGQGVVLRRRGSSAELASNGSMWSPHPLTDAESEVRLKYIPAEALAAEVPPAVPPRVRCSELAIVASRVSRRSASAVASQAAAAALARRQQIDAF